MFELGDHLASQSYDTILNDIGQLEIYKELSNPVKAYLAGDYSVILQGPPSQKLFKQFLERLSTKDENYPDRTPWNYVGLDGVDSAHALLIGLAVFNAFLQANVTGPPLSERSLLYNKGTDFAERASARKKLFRSLDVDGLSVYQHIPHVELFCLARAIFTEYFPRVTKGKVHDSKWMRIRINAYHQRLLSSGTSNARLNDSAISLQIQIEADLLALEPEILDPKSTYSTEAKVQFLLEKAQIFLKQGLDVKARENLQMAKNVSQFNYALSGALGKRTKFQQKETSQLVVLAKSNKTATTMLDSDGTTKSSAVSLGVSTANDAIVAGPIVLDLNDDTLLETIEFSKSGEDNSEFRTLPPELMNVKPDEQPQLDPLDQIILLTEATIKDALSPLDKLNSEEILPYAVRVLNDKPTNWQIYTQALLVRSRIESHRSRTQERSVLQMQVIVDQIIAETQEVTTAGETGGIPQNQITQFLPKAKPAESAPVTERLRYIHQLNTPTRWEVETELAYAWSSAGSFISALEIFKRLQLWAEVALCYHSVGQEDKARQIVRRQLYFSNKGPDLDHFAVDSDAVVAEKWDGDVRSPPPPHAPRLWCILGDLDQDPDCWQRAWDISKLRYARAQRTLGEYYNRHGDLINAREAYMKATVVNRQNGETWSRLGDIDLRTGNWDGAVIAFQQSIMIDDTDAKTYSNLGTALVSKHAESTELRRAGTDSQKTSSSGLTTIGDDATQDPNRALNPNSLLLQALRAYKRGASLAHTNWQIWDNVLTIALRTTPPSFPDMLLALRAIIRIRAPTIGDAAIDIAVLRVLVSEAVSTDRNSNDQSTHIYTPPRGSFPYALLTTMDNDVVPLITTRAALWSLVEKVRLWQRDYRGALECAEKAWRVVTTAGTNVGAGTGKGWLEDVESWKEVAAMTEALVGAYENYGGREVLVEGGQEEEKPEMVEKAWKTKAKSAVRGVLGRAKGVWEGTEEWDMLQGRLEELKST